MSTMEHYQVLHPVKTLQCFLHVHAPAFAQVSIVCSTFRSIVGQIELGPG